MPQVQLLVVFQLVALAELVAVGQVAKAQAAGAQKAGAVQVGKAVPELRVRSEPAPVPASGTGMPVSPLRLTKLPTKCLLRS